MTSQFDDLVILAGYWSEGKIPEDLRGEVREVVNEAVKQAGEHEPDWNFETFMKKQYRGHTEKEVDALFSFELAARFRFLGETHETLDHQEKYHFRVFSGTFMKRMQRLYRNLEERGLRFS